MALSDIFATAIPPVMTVAGVGTVLGRHTDVDPDSLNTLVVHVLASALLVFSAGVYVAAWSGGSRGRTVTRRVLELPFLYAVLAGLGAR